MGEMEIGQSPAQRHQRRARAKSVPHIARGGRKQIRDLYRVMRKMDQGRVRLSQEEFAAALRDIDWQSSEESMPAEWSLEPVEVDHEEVVAETKSAAVTAAMLTLVMAILSSPLAACLPVTHLHLSRLPIGAGHSSIIDALKREWPARDFDVRLHVYQRTKHVSGVAAVTPGLDPLALEALRRMTQTEKFYVPLPDCGERIVVEESKRDRDPQLLTKCRDLVLAGLGHGDGGIADLIPARPAELDSPLVYLRVMADRTQPNDLISTVSDVREDGLVYLLQRYPIPAGWVGECGSEECDGTLMDLVRLIAPDTSPARRHMHRSHFGRAFFLECVNPEAARMVIKAVQEDSIQNIDGMRFSIHAESKKTSPACPRPADAEVVEVVEDDKTEKPQEAHSDDPHSRLFTLDPEKRIQSAKALAACRAGVEHLRHEPCSCELPGRHTAALHSLFAFKRSFRGSQFEPAELKDQDSASSIGPSDDAESESAGSSSSPPESVYTSPDCSSTSTTSHQPYEDGYGFPHAPPVFATAIGISIWSSTAGWVPWFDGPSYLQGI
eukprot:Hpha_TRINITY_DN16237_c1_g4::TRINITY_DN16237_c1_g4_i1::g.16484::m.16484